MLDKTRIAVAGRDVTLVRRRLLGRGPAQRACRVGRGRAGRAARQRRDPAGPGSQAVRLDGRARRRARDAVAAMRRCRQQGAAAGGRPRRPQRRRGGRSHESGARRAAAFRHGGAAAARSDRQAEGRQDHAVGYQGQPVRHGARPRRPRGDRGGAEEPARGLFGRQQRGQGAALCLPGQQGPGRDDADAVRLRARQRRPCGAGRRRPAANSSTRRSSTISRPASARPAGFASAVVPALGALSRLSTGTLVVSDREVKLSGDALYDAAAAQIRAGLRQGFSARLAVQAGNFGQAAGRAGGCHRLPATVRRSAGQGAHPLRARQAPTSIRIRPACSTG